MNNYQTEISIDWLSLTVPRTSLNDFYNLFNEKPILLDKGFRGYQHSAIILSSGRIGWSEGREEAHIDLSSTALALYQNGCIDKLFDLIAMVLDVNGHFTRIDIAYDDKYGLINISDVEDSLNNGDVVTRWKSKSKHSGSLIEGNQSTGETLYVGSNKSNAKLRVYDKALEQKLIDTHWTRFELQLRDKYSTSCAREILNSFIVDGEKGVAEISLGILRGFIEFKDKASDLNPCRRTLLVWWDTFVQHYEKVKIALPKKERSIEKVKLWFEHQVGPSLSLIKEHDGSLNWVNRIAFVSKKRLRPHQLAMLN